MRHGLGRRTLQRTAVKIGIDAKWLWRGPPSGRRVVRSLIEGLAEVAVDDEIHLFLDARSRHVPATVDAARIPPEHRHYVWAANNQLSNRFLLPRAVDRLGLDAVVYQNFVPPPRRARHARIAFVHDVIFESHPEFFTWRERLYFSPLRGLTRSATRVCTVSESEKARLVHFGYGEQTRIDVVPNAVDRSFTTREQIGTAAVDQLLGSLGVNGRFVLFVGRLNVRKNIVTLVRALGLIGDPELMLVVAGPPDSTTANLRAIATSAGIADRLRLIGTPSEDALRALYAAASLFCFPSYDESFGLPPVEAMASGTPVVVSNIPALVETCGDAAVYVDPSDAQALAAAIFALLTDAPRSARLRASGIVRARSFNQERTARHLLASVRAAVAGSA
jgi:glycosyltransferase involved in cell wall biosynthesis